MEIGDVRPSLHHLMRHYTTFSPGCRLNLVGIALPRQCLNRRIPDLITLQSEIAAWQARRDAAQAAIDWQLTTIDA